MQSLREHGVGPQLTCRKLRTPWHGRYSTTYARNALGLRVTGPSADAQTMMNRTMHAAAMPYVQQQQQRSHQDGSTMATLVEMVTKPGIGGGAPRYPLNCQSCTDTM